MRVVTLGSLYSATAWGGRNTMGSLCKWKDVRSSGTGSMTGEEVDLNAPNAPAVPPAVHRAHAPLIPVWAGLCLAFIGGYAVARNT